MLHAFYRAIVRVSLVGLPLAAGVYVGAGCGAPTAPGDGTDEGGLVAGVTVIDLWNGGGNSQSNGDSDDDGSASAFAILADNTALDFGDGVNEMSVAVSTDSPEPLAFTAVSDAAWVTVSPTNGTLTAEAQTLAVALDRTQLSEESDGLVRVSANGAQTLFLHVHATPKPAQLQVSTTALDFGSTLSADTFSVQNAGDGSLAYRVSSGASWAHATPAEGETAGGTAQVSVTVSRDGLAAGAYGTTILATDGRTAIPIDVSMVVPGDGNSGFEVSRSLLDFGSTETSLSFTVRSSDSTQREYALRTNAEWAALSSGGGVNSGPEDTIVVSVGRDGLSPGEYAGSVTLSSGGVDVYSIALRMGVPDPEAPVLELSADVLDFGEEANSLGFSVRNAGNGTLRWSVASDASWLGVWPTSGENTGDAEPVDVLLDRDGLSLGSHTAVLTVTAAHGVSQRIEVRVTRIDPYDMEHFPFFQYLISGDDIPYLTEENRHVFMRPVVSNFWFNPTYLEERRAWYKAEVPGAQLGRYFVPYNATPPPIPGSLANKMANIPDAWLMRNTSGGYFTIGYSNGETRQNLDLTLPEVRAAQVDFWREQAQDWEFLLIDHFIYKFSNVFDTCAPGRDAFFAGMLSLLQEWRARGNRPIIINLITTTDNWAELIPWVDGIFTESALNAIYMPRAQDREPLIRRELGAWRAAMDAGKTVLLTNNRSWAGVGGDTELSQPQVCGPLFSAAVCLVRNPGDALYYNTNIMRGNDFNSYDFHTWWRRLGRPLGPLWWDGLVIKREFTRGRVELDISTAQPQVRVTFN